MNMKTEKKTNWAETPTSIRKSKLHEAAEVASAYQDSVAAFIKKKSHDTAKGMIDAAETLIKHQNDVGITFVNQTNVRHRALVGQQYLHDNPERPAVKNGKGTEVYYDERGRKVTKFL